MVVSTLEIYVLNIKHTFYWNTFVWSFFSVIFDTKKDHTNLFLLRTFKTLQGNSKLCMNKVGTINAFNVYALCDLKYVLINWKDII